MEVLRNYLVVMLVGICLILMLFAFITDSITNRRRYALFFISLGAVLMLIADRFAYFYNGLVEGGFWTVRISKFFVYASFPIIIFTFNQYLTDLFLHEGKLNNVPKRIKVTNFIIYTSILVLIISQFTGLYYTYDDNNLYRRSDGFVISYIFPALAIFIQVSVIIQFHKQFRKRLFIPLILFTITPLIAAVIEFFIHGVSLRGITIVGMIVLLFCFTVWDTNEQIELAHKKEIDFLKEREENAQLMVLQTSESLASAIDAKDEYTNGHSTRVAEYAVMIAEHAGKSKEECEKIRVIALLHDVGKIGVPNSLINKKGKLTDEEFAIMKKHPVIGDEILSKIKIFPELSIGAKYHHERYDGKGYPEGLKGEEIPEIARLIAVADAYDAMTSKRSYRDVLPQKVIRDEIVKGIGTQFDPQFAEIMIKLIDEDKEYKMRQQ